MPVVKTWLIDYAKFSAKTAPDRVGTRYEASKSIATSRYSDAVANIVTVRELARNVLSDAGVPAGQWALYLSFVQYITKFAYSFVDETLKKRIAGAKARCTAMGADPAILDKLVNIVFGTTV